MIILQMQGSWKKIIISGGKKMTIGSEQNYLKERIKKKIFDAFDEIFLPMFMFIWAFGLGVCSFFIVISILWKVWNFL